MWRRLVWVIRRRIALKLALTLVGFVALIMLAAGLYLSRALEEFAVESLAARLAAVGQVVQGDARGLFNAAPPADVKRFLTLAAEKSGARITLIAPDGRVVGESERQPEDWGAMENHAGRREVKVALGGRVGRDLRQSATLDAQLLYVAVPVRDGGHVIGVLRLALPLAAVTASYATLRRVMLLGGVMTLLAALGIGVFVAGRVTRPVIEMQSIARQMSEGNFFARAPTRSPDEIGALGRSLNVMAGRLREKIQDLQQEQSKVTAILDAMVEGVIAVDGHEHIVLMNERARGIFGLGPGRGERKPFLEVVRNADLHQVFRESRGAPEGHVLRREARVSGPSDRVLQVHAVPLRLSGGERGLVMVLHDVTALRRLEQVRTEFVANVSHELRTPLTAIQGYLETLLGGALEEPENARRFVEIVFRQTERLGRLINDLTDLSNIELGKVSLSLVSVPLDEVVESAVAMIRPQAESGGVTIRVELPAGLPRARADDDRLTQILVNLVDNAVKYTGRGGTVSISAREVDDGMLEVAVADTGIGIPAPDLPRVTERFYRVDKARSRELGGTGLGLAIVKHLVMAHGGELKLESEVGKGTTARFTVAAEKSA
jgi:two-component system phosphate regulon sensor histidine kinase PhoR